MLPEKISWLNRKMSKPKFTFTKRVVNDEEPTANLSERIRARGDPIQFRGPMTSVSERIETFRSHLNPATDQKSSSSFIDKFRKPKTTGAPIDNEHSNAELLDRPMFQGEPVERRKPKVVFLTKAGDSGPREPVNSQNTLMRFLERVKANRPVRVPTDGPLSYEEFCSRLKSNNEYTKAIHDHLMSSDDSLTLEKLTPFERSYCHRLSELISLNHESVENGSKKTKDMRLSKTADWDWGLVPECTGREPNFPSLLTKRQIRNASKYCNECGRTGDKVELFENCHVSWLCCSDCIDEDEEIGAHKWEPL
jgi:hypothetical protein